MNATWFPDEWSAAGRVLASSVLVLVWAVVAVRLIGRRSLSKMTSVDFVTTVALGSIVGATASASGPFWQGALAFATLLVVQWIVAWGRRHAGWSTIVDNEPLLLMDGPRFIDDHMRAARITEDDVWAKLRAANVTDPTRIRAVVLESTGDVSVLHGGDELDPDLLTGVRVGNVRTAPSDDHR